MQEDKEMKVLEQLLLKIDNQIELKMRVLSNTLLHYISALN